MLRSLLKAPRSRVVQVLYKFMCGNHDRTADESAIRLFDVARALAAHTRPISGARSCTVPRGVRGFTPSASLQPSEFWNDRRDHTLNSHNEPSTEVRHSLRGELLAWISAK